MQGPEGVLNGYDTLMSLPESDRERWNRKYRDRGPESYGTEPAEWLAAHRELIERQPRGPARDVACGDGALRIRALQRAAGKVVTATDYLNARSDLRTGRS